MKKQLSIADILIAITIALLAVITITGLFSFRLDKSYFLIDQTGQSVLMFGSGIYAQESYLKAPGFIGSDYTMLLLVIPLLTYAFLSNRRRRTSKSYLLLSASLSIVPYYAASLAFGAVRNTLLPAYIALLICSFFALIFTVLKGKPASLTTLQSGKLPPKGVSLFLLLAGVAFFCMWLPEIIPTLTGGSTAPLEEVYTTKISYVLDMGILCPLMLLCLYLLKKKKRFGIVLLPVMLTLCAIRGVLLVSQSIFQLIAGMVIPIPILIIRMGVFLILAVVALTFDRRFFKSIGA